MRESLLYKKLKNQLSQQNVFLQRIESGGTGLGIPDLFFQHTSINGWIELKQINHNQGEYVKIPFRPGQLGWLKMLLSYGGNVYLLCNFINTHKIILLKNYGIKDCYTVGELYFNNNFLGDIKSLTLQDFI